MIKQDSDSFKGSIVALVTPMKCSGKEIDYDALKSLIELHCEKGTNAILICGTTGESCTLSNEELEKIMIESLKYSKNKIKLICGCGTNSTYETIRRTKLAIKHKMDAVLLVTPYYNCPVQEGMYEHFKSVARECPEIPIILYNVPKRTGRDLLPETVERLANEKNIIGIKEASGCLKRIEQLLKIPNFKVFCGDDLISFEAILKGAAGVMSVTSNIFPKHMSFMCQLIFQKQIDEARVINDKLKLMHEKLFVESNPIPVKWLMHHMNLIEDSIRLPLTPLSKQFHQELKDSYRECMKKLGCEAI